MFSPSCYISSFDGLVSGHSQILRWTVLIWLGEVTLPGVMCDDFQRALLSWAESPDDSGVGDSLRDPEILWQEVAFKVFSHLLSITLSHSHNNHMC